MPSDLRNLSGSFPLDMGFHCRTGSGNACDVSPQLKPLYGGACRPLHGLRLSSGRLSAGEGDQKCVLSEDHEARDQGWFRYEMVFKGFGVAKLCTAILF